MTAEEADLGVRLGPGHYADRESRGVTHDRVSPASSPSDLKKFGPFEGFDTLAELQQALLIRQPAGTVEQLVRRLWPDPARALRWRPTPITSA